VDWDGPFVMVPGNGDRACPTTWSTRVSTLRSGLEAADAACGCTCTPPSTTCTAAIELHTDAACSSSDVEETAPAGACIVTVGVSAIIASAEAVPSPCTAETTTELPEVSWTTLVSVCAPPDEPAACEGGVCLPMTDADAPACIAREGMHECPEGPYAMAHVFFGGATDDRDCSACSCDQPLGVICHGTSQLEQFANLDCSGEPTNTAPLGTCESATSSVRYVPQSMGECIPSEASTPIGGVEPIDPVTLCCTR
jgi:hypothetical protein